MKVYNRADLRSYHSFGIETSCDVLIEIESIDDIIQVYQDARWAQQSKLMIGQGSNTLFTEHFQGVVLVNRILGRSISRQGQEVILHTGSGEDWHQIVHWTLQQQLYGLENLALIPGCVGSAPIQNIGAYGVELKDVCAYVDVIDLASLQVKRLLPDDCNFGYRDSIFKGDLKDKVLIIAVGLKFPAPEDWRPNLGYGPLKQLPAESSAQQVFDLVCQVRQSKLPDPQKIGNAGSFFKNPVIDLDSYQRLKQAYPEIVAYPAEAGMKLAAGWLIEQAGMKGKRIGGAQVHTQQALVLINIDQATAQDVIALASEVCQAVASQFAVNLQHEVRFIGKTEETNLAQCISSTKVSDTAVSDIMVSAKKP